jgi:hypothetical protein
LPELAKSKGGYSIPVRTAFCRAGPSEKCSAGQALNYKTNIFLLGKDNCTKPKKAKLKKSSSPN